MKKCSIFLTKQLIIKFKVLNSRKVVRKYENNNRMSIKLNKFLHSTITIIHFSDSVF